MNVAIVFFVALGVFLVLLSRRAWRSGLRFNKIWAGLQNAGLLFVVGLVYLGKMAIQLGQTIGRVIKVRRPARIPRPAVSLPKPTALFSQPSSPEPSFWDESAQKRPELLSHLEEGEELLKQDKLEEAEGYLLKAAMKNPRDGRIYADLGQIYLRSKSYSDAIEALKVAVKLDKYNPARHYDLARAYWGNKDGQRAIASIREAIGLDPVTEKYRHFLEELLNKK